MQKKYLIITNNPLVFERYHENHDVLYKEISYEEVLREVRDRIHEGHQLLTHPLSGSVKPNETPYKSIMISTEKGAVEQRAVSIIESAIGACQKFVFKSDRYKPEVYKDFQVVDASLLESAMASADA